MPLSFYSSYIYVYLLVYLHFIKEILSRCYTCNYQFYCTICTFSYLDLKSDIFHDLTINGLLICNASRQTISNDKRSRQKIKKNTENISKRKRGRPKGSVKSKNSVKTKSSNVDKKGLWFYS